MRAACRSPAGRVRCQLLQEIQTAVYRGAMLVRADDGSPCAVSTLDSAGRDSLPCFTRMVKRHQTGDETSRNCRRSAINLDDNFAAAGMPGAVT
jgi:hypothetical protein